MQPYNQQESDPAKRIVLTNERTALREFLASPGYRAAQRLVDEKYNDAVSLIFNLPLETADDITKIIQVIAEGRAHRAFGATFRDRLEELDALLGQPTEDEK